MHFLLYRVRFPDGDEEPADIKTVDGVIFPDNRTADVVQVQGSHSVQTGTTARGLATRQFCSLCRMNTIDEQDRFIIIGFLFQLFVSFHERLLRFGTAFMWNANGFSVAEAIAVQPFSHARNGVTDSVGVRRLAGKRQGAKKQSGSITFHKASLIGGLALR